MANIPDHIRIKLQHAEDFPPKIMELCLKELTYSGKRQRRRISVYLGEMAQALRSALNYAMWDFAEKNLNSLLSEEECERVRWSHDFPIEKSKDEFERSKVRMLRHIASNFRGVYQFLERAQPYHGENNFLLHLRTLSNDATHTIPIEIEPIHANDIVFGCGLKPRILGNKVIVPGHGGAPLTVYSSTPCFVRELNVFVSEEKRWVLILIDLGGQTRPSLIPFIEKASYKVNELISGFYALW